MHANMIFIELLNIFFNTIKIDFDDFNDDEESPLKFAANKNNYEILMILISNLGNEIKNNCFCGCN